MTMKKIICGQFKQETNRYAPGVSDERAYRNREWFWGEEAIRAHYLSERTELSGFLTNWIFAKIANLFRLWH